MNPGMHKGGTMASKETALPSFFEKRELLYAEQADAAALRRMGATFLAGGVIDAALELFQKAGDAEGLAKVLEASRAAGDTFSFEAALRALGRKAAPGEWVAIGETALAAGQLSFAYQAFEKADDQGGLERVRREMAAAGIQPVTA
jgi:tetratricopeptide (TPR) repeat protein